MVANKLRRLSAAQRGSDGWPLAGVPILIFIINVVARGWRVAGIVLQAGISQHTVNTSHHAHPGDINTLKLNKTTS